MSRATAAILLMAMGLCGCGRTDRTTAVRKGPELLTLDPAQAPHGQRRLFQRLQWDRPGSWTVVTSKRLGGPAATFLAARDRFGDRLLTASAGGYQLWRGKFDCAVQTASFLDGAWYRGGARPEPIRGRPDPLSPEDVRAACSSRGSIHGTPVEVAARAQTVLGQPSRNRSHS
jgi:hypothetical protein